MKRLSFLRLLTLVGIILGLIGLIVNAPLPALAAEPSSIKKPFLMPVEDVFTISGRGTVVTGCVERGEISVGQDLELVGLLESPQSLKVTVVAIESSRKQVSKTKMGDNIGILLRGKGVVLDAAVVRRGQVLAALGSIKPTKQFRANVEILPVNKGGKNVVSGYRPMVHMRTTDFSGVLTLPQSIKSLSPGTKALVTIDLKESAAVEKGQVFALREFGRTIGSGVVE